MRLLTILTASIFKMENVDPKSERAKIFVQGLKNLAQRFDGRIQNIEWAGKMIRISVASEKVFAGLTEYLKKHGIETVEVDVLDEFFAEDSAPSSTKAQ